MLKILLIIPASTSQKNYPLFLLYFHIITYYSHIMLGALRLRSSGLTALDFFDHITENYGIEEDGLGSQDTENSAVVIPECSFQLTTEHLQQLQNQVDPLQASDNHGIELYDQTLQFIHLIVMQNSDLYTSI